MQLLCDHTMHKHVLVNGHKKNLATVPLRYPRQLDLRHVRYKFGNDHNRCSLGNRKWRQNSEDLDRSMDAEVQELRIESG